MPKRSKSKPGVSATAAKRAPRRPGRKGDPGHGNGEPRAVPSVHRHAAVPAADAVAQCEADGAGLTPGWAEELGALQGEIDVMKAGKRKKPYVRTSQQREQMRIAQRQRRAKEYYDGKAKQTCA